MDTCTGWSKVRCDVLVGLLPVLLPNLVLTGLGLLMRGQAQRVAEAQAVGHFGTERFLRQVGLNAFFLLLVGIWLWRRRVGWTVCGWRRERSSRVVGLGVLLVVATLLLRAWPFAPERLSIPDTVCLSAHSEVWWALVTYTVVAVSEETLYRGFLQGALSTWLVR